MKPSDQPSSEVSPSETRRPYQPPRLRRLGSVRELTLGPTTMGGKELVGKKV